MRHNLYLVHLCPFLGLSLFMSYLCDLFFIFSLIFIIINHKTSFSRRTCFVFFLHFLEYFLLFLDDNLDEKRIIFKKQASSVAYLLVDFFANSSVALLIKLLLMKKSVYWNNLKQHLFFEILIQLSLISIHSSLK